ncbi:hypothetical protein DPMN_186201 [Dreissena polymorpha]|uniref:Uncharacterized protein n=1 Tax=Dreissena polymorpha TaxID=45954 RepID=A0A9D4DM98_DREPO|nr:hypothetical protein DPMN_186201 [Dreissena polymorpha]
MDIQDGRDTALDLVDDTDATHAPGKCGSIAEYRPLRFYQSLLAGLDENVFTRPLVEKGNIRRKDTPSHHGKSPFKLRQVGGIQEQFVKLNEEEDNEHEHGKVILSI